MKRLVGFLLFILAFSVFTPALSSAAVVWSDDFQDSDYTDWSVLDGEFSAADQVLRAVGSDEYHCIQHSSSVAYGNWTFDVYVNSSVSKSQWLLYSFIADEFVEGSDTYSGVMVPRNGYSLNFESLFAYIRQWSNSIPTTVGRFSLSFSGWRTISIIRDNTGHFELYYNGTLKAEMDDTTHTAGNVFGWSTKPGHGIDNIIVSELETPALTIDPLLLGAGVAIVVVVIVIVVYIRRR
ncbi:MAG: hypothetical protein ACFFDD_05995 [Promethearchaeota archaeon]